MVQSAVVPYAHVLGDGLQTSFAYTYMIAASSEMQVYVNGVFTSSYTLTGVGVPTGGNIVFLAPPASGAVIFHRRVTSQTQQTDYQNNDPFSAASHENALDKLTRLIQDQTEPLSRRPALAPQSLSTQRDLIIPNSGTGRIWAWNSDFSGMVLLDLAAPIAPIADPSLLDDFSGTLPQLQTVIDPGELGTESFPTALSGELARLRWAIRDAKLALNPRITQWYQSPFGTAITNDGVVDVEWFGAVSGQECGAALEAAFNSTAKRIRLTGTYTTAQIILIGRSNLTIEGPGAIVAHATNPGAVLKVGFVPGAATPVAVANITLDGLTLDGDDIALPLVLSTLTTGVVRRCTIKDSIAAVLNVFTSSDITIHDNSISGGNGVFGDGIYCGSVVNAKILRNTVSDVTRIGIVTENGGDGTPSVAPLILGNTVSNAHNATSGEANAGIWVENTLGATILGNRLFDLTNTPGAQSSRGITVGDHSGAAATFFVCNNDVTDALLGLHLNPATTDTVFVDGLSVRKSELSSFIAGVNIQSGYHIEIRHLEVGTNAYQFAGSGAVLVDAQSAISTLTIADSTIGDAAGSTYANQAADFNIFALAQPLATLTLQNLQGWRVTFHAFPDRLFIGECALLHDPTTYNGLAATGFLFMSNSYYSSVNATGPFHLYVGAAVEALFDNVLFNNTVMNLGNNGSILPHVRMANCLFKNACQFAIDGSVHLALTDSRWDTYPSTGAIHANFSNFPLHLRLRGMEFSNASDVTPLQLWNFQPTTLLITDTLRSSNITTLSSMTPAVTGFTFTAQLP
jgi:Right handed beta helix region